MKHNIKLDKSWLWGVAVGYGIFSYLVAVIGWSYLPIPVNRNTELPNGLDFATKVFLQGPDTGIAIFGVLWLFAGLAGIAAAVMCLERWVFEKAIKFQILMHLVWGGAYTYGWIDEGGRVYLNSRSYLAFTVLLILILALVTKLRAETVTVTRSERP